jgi:hypothetical protein
MRKKVAIAIAIAALLTGALMLPSHQASAHGGGWFGQGHAGFGGYGYGRGYDYGRAFAYARYGYRRGSGYYGGYAGSSCDLDADCYN